MIFKRSIVACIVLLFSYDCGSVYGVTRLHEPYARDSNYKDLAIQYPMGGHLKLAFDIGGTGAVYRGSGTLVAPNYVLTAGHLFWSQDEGYMLSDFLTDDPISHFDFDGQPITGDEYKIAGVTLHPNWDGSDTSDGYDLAVVRLRELELTASPASLYTTGSEVGEEGTLVGFGMSGTGLTGETTAGGTKRAGRNMIDTLGGALGYSDRLMLSDFDNPQDPDESSMGSDEPLGLEGCGAEGDSGGEFLSRRQAARNWPVCFLSRKRPFGTWTRTRTTAIEWLQSVYPSLRTGSNPSWTPVQPFRGRAARVVLTHTATGKRKWSRENRTQLCSRKRVHTMWQCARIVQITG